MASSPTVDLRTGNFGSRRTEGIDFTLRGAMDGLGGTFSAGLDGTYLLVKREKLLPNLPYTNLIGIFTFTGDLGLRWKHNAFISYAERRLERHAHADFPERLQELRLAGLGDASRLQPAGERLYHLQFLGQLYRPRPHVRLTAGVRNLFDRDPPFAITYDSNTGAGSSWEPRVADPRGRSFTMAAEVSF